MTFVLCFRVVCVFFIACTHLILYYNIMTTISLRTHNLSCSMVLFFNTDVSFMRQNAFVQSRYLLLIN